MKKILLVILLTIMLTACSSNITEKNEEKTNEVDTMTIVVFETSLGNFEVELNQEKAPISVDNFLAYVNEGFYDNLIFHRVIPNFMVQGGGFDKEMNEKDTKEPIKNEADNGLKNDKYTIAMARTQVVDSATSQFFINTNNNDFLNNGGRDFGYAVFGKVTEGQDVIDKIAAVKTTNAGMYQDVPAEPLIITKAYVKE